MKKISFRDPYPISSPFIQKFTWVGWLWVPTWKKFLPLQFSPVITYSPVYLPTGLVMLKGFTIQSLPWRNSLTGQEKKEKWISVNMNSSGTHRELWPHGGGGTWFWRWDLVRVTDSRPGDKSEQRGICKVSWTILTAGGLVHRGCCRPSWEVRWQRPTCMAGCIGRHGHFSLIA